MRLRRCSVTRHTVSPVSLTLRNNPRTPVKIANVIYPVSRRAFSFEIEEEKKEKKEKTNRIRTKKNYEIRNPKGESDKSARSFDKRWKKGGKKKI